MGKLTTSPIYYLQKSLDLFEKIGVFFSKESNEFGLNPDNFNIHIGFYRKNASPEFPAKNLDEYNRAKKLNLLLDYKIFISKLKIKVDLLPEESEYYHVTSRNHPIDFFDKKNITDQYLDRIILKADFVYDDIKQLKKSGLIHASDIAKYSQTIRERVFGQKLDAIKLPRKYIHPAVFYADAITKGTYDSNFNYYEKWVNPKNAFRTYSLNDLSDRYLTENFSELKLIKDKYYVLFILDSVKLLYQLEHDKIKDVIKLTPVYFSGLSADETPASLLSTPSKYNKKAIFFYTEDGVKQYPKSKFISYPKFKLHIHSNEVVVSPETMVKEAWNAKGENTKAKVTENWGEWQWFLEMVHLFFTDQSYELDTSILLNKPLVPADRGVLFLDDYRKVRNNSTGLLRKEFEKVVKNYEYNKSLYVFPQGLPIGRNGKQLLVGLDDSHVYTRYTDIGLTTKIPLDTFFINYSVSEHSKSIYKKTKGLIPFIALVFIVSGGAVGGLIFGSAAITYAFKYFVIDYVFYKITKPALKKVVKGIKEQFYMQFIFVLTYGFAAIFTDQSNNKEKFILGFLKGLSIDSINSLLFKYKQLIYEGPRYYRWYKLMSRLKASVRLIENKLIEIKSHTDEKTSQILAEKLIDIAEHTKNGFLLLVSNLYFLDYKQVQGPLNTIADLSEIKTPTRKDWEKARKKQLKEFLEKYQSIIDKTAIDKPNNIEDVKNLYLLIQKSLHGMHIGFDVLNSVKYTGNFITMSIVGLVGGVIGTYYVGVKDYLNNDSKGIKKIASLLFKPITQFNKYTPDESEKLGSMTGHILGALFLNGSIFKKGTRLGKLSGNKADNQKAKDKDGKKSNLIIRLAKYGKNKAMNEFIKDEFGASIVMPIVELVFSHYIIVFERIKRDLKGGEKNILDNLFAEINLIILGNDDKNLKVFQTKEEQIITFDKALILLSLLDHKLKELLVEMASDPLLPEKLDNALIKMETSQIPSFENMIDFQKPTEWIEEALIFVAMSHLHSAIVELREAVRLMYDPVDVRTGFKIVDILNILSISVTEDESRIELLKNINEIFIDDVANEKKQSEAGSAPN